MKLMPEWLRDKLMRDFIETHHYGAVGEPAGGPVPVDDPDENEDDDTRPETGRDGPGQS